MIYLSYCKEGTGDVQWLHAAIQLAPHPACPAVHFTPISPNSVMGSQAGWMVVALAAALIGTVLRVLFALILLLCILPVSGLCKLLGLLSPAVISPRTLSGCALVLTQAAFWATLKFSSLWVRITPADDTQQQWAALMSGLGERPTMILGNHTSFMDTLITISSAPVSVVWKMKTYFNRALINMPILGGIIKAQQQFSVPFKGSADGDFSVDRDAMAKVDQEVDAFIASGGTLAGAAAALYSLPSLSGSLMWVGVSAALWAGWCGAQVSCASSPKGSSTPHPPPSCPSATGA